MIQTGSKNRSRTWLTVALLGVCLLSSGCATSHLIRYGADEKSAFKEPENDLGRGVVKPVSTFIGFLPAVAWDVATFPIQIIFGVYPYNDRFMDPEQVHNEL